MLLLDVDGTVCESTQMITIEMAAVLILAKRPLVFISGTDNEELRRMLSPVWQFDNVYTAPSSGAELWNLKECLYFQTDSFTPEEIDLIKQNVTGWMKAWGVVPLCDDVFLDRDSQYTVSLLGRSAPRHAKDAFDPTGERRRGLITLLQEHLPNFSYAVGGTTSVDIHTREWNKAKGLFFITRQLDTALADIRFIGDQLGPSGNDHSLKVILPKANVFETTGPAQTLEILRSMK